MAMEGLNFPPMDLPPETEALRAEVRQFLAEERANGGYEPHCDAWMSHWLPDFSRKLGARGWIGIMWPKKYGGQERSALDRYVLTEELMSAGTPVFSHWVSDRQIGPTLLAYGSEAQCALLLPEIAKGNLFLAAGLSEPDSGSDLASIRTSLLPDKNGKLRLNGRKIWTSAAHLSQYIIVLCRTSPFNIEKRHEGISQVLVRTDTPGISMRPIHLLDGRHHFNEVVFEDVEVEPDQIIGEPGNGWKQITDELVYERSGPERYLSTFPLIVELANRINRDGGTSAQKAALGRLVAQLWTLRRMSVRIVGLMASGKGLPNNEAAVIKDLGTRFEQESIALVRSVVDARPSKDSLDPLEVRLAEAIFHSPGMTLRGGTNEILRGVIARGLGLR